jgi:Beta-propeller repeat
LVVKDNNQRPVTEEFSMKQLGLGILLNVILLASLIEVRAAEFVQVSVPELSGTEPGQSWTSTVNVEAPSGQTTSAETQAEITTTISDNSGPTLDQPSKVGLQRGFGRLPLSFVVNQGQTEAQVKFLSRGSGHTLFLTSDEAVLTLAKARIRKPEVGMRNVRSMVSLPESNTDKLFANPRSTIVQKPIVLRMKLIGAKPQPELVGLEELPGKVNYFVGNDSKKWQTNISAYAKVKYKDVYPGIDLVYYGNQGQLEYDFIVGPGVDPKTITVDIQGADKLEVDARGDLVLHTKGDEIRQGKPLIYQEVDGDKRIISGHYVLKGKHQVGFEVAMYDATKPLVIDPVLSYATYLGGSGNDAGLSIAVDSSGNAYVTGFTLSPNFPTTSGAFDVTCGTDGSCRIVDGEFVFLAEDAFVTKLNSTGSALVYSTYLGGSEDDTGLGVAVDSTGNAYVTGWTQSTDFPTTKGAFQEVKSSGSGFSGPDAFVVKLNPVGNGLVYSTYVGGSGQDLGTGIGLDSSGNAYVAGTTLSIDFPTTTGAFQTTYSGGAEASEGAFNEAFVTKLNPAGSSLVYSTYLGGTDRDQAFAIALDSSGNAYVTGETFSTDFPITSGAFQTILPGFFNAFVTKLNSTGSALIYSTYLGGSSSGFGAGRDEGLGIAVDPSGNAYVTGQTNAIDFPTTIGAFQPTPVGSAFVTKLNRTASALIYSTYLGGTRGESGRSVAVDSAGNAYITGGTVSIDFPTTPDAIDTTCGTDGSCNFDNGNFFADAFVTKLNSTGSALIYSTYLGGSRDEDGEGIGLDSSGNAYVTGWTLSTDFPTTNGALQTTFSGPTSLFGGPGGDAFVAKLNSSSILNDLVTFVPIEASFLISPNTSGCPTGFVGTFSFSARLSNKSGSPPLSDLVSKVMNLSNGNLVQNADGGPGGVGATLTVAKIGNFSDGVLSAGEFVDVPFNICLKNTNSFTFLTDVLGMISSNFSNSLALR